MLVGHTAEDSRNAAQNQTPRSIESRMGVHLCGRCLQPRQNAESGLYASSFCTGLRRSVSKLRKAGVWITEFPRNAENLSQTALHRPSGEDTPLISPHFSAPC